ncbi:MAG TPA: hypothetical protein DDY43_08705 [Synechococcales bacterium UBA10510]|nr:hypothetical protein [Synechococcales bacterium UBA10510]
MAERRIGLLLLLASISIQPLRAQPIWQPMPDDAPAQPKQRNTAHQWYPLSPTETSGGRRAVPASGGPIRWQALSTLASQAKPLAWRLVPAAAVDLATAANTPDPSASPAKAAAIANGPPINSFNPTASDYTAQLRLGDAVPTAQQLSDRQSQLSFFQRAPFGAGEQRGTGNQNYAARLDVGLTEQLQFSGFYSVADDPLFAPISGKTKQPSNYWESYGGSLQLRVAGSSSSPWKMALTGSVESWNVGSGDSATPNIFNNSISRVFTRNLVGSLALPLSWQATPSLSLSFTPGVSFLPSSQGSGQGGSGSFYGNNITVAAGASWRPIPSVTLFGSGLLPLGPGNNSFNADLEYSRVAILTAGINWALNPRIGLEGMLTNGFGATPATAVLALPSENRLGYSARFIYNPGAPDTPKLPFTPRSRSLTFGGLTVNTALVPPAGTANIWINADNRGNAFTQLGWSASNDFQFILLNAGAFQKVDPITTLVSKYASDGGANLRIGGKAVFLQQLRGAPFTAAGSITLGRNNDSSSFQGYLYAEAIATWEANSWLAFNLNPKLAWNGISTPIGLGVSANIQLGKQFQLIPELNAVNNSAGAGNASLALRWLVSPSTAFDLYVSNAAGIYDIGQLLSNRDARVGGKFSIQF